MRDEIYKTCAGQGLRLSVPSDLRRVGNALYFVPVKRNGAKRPVESIAIERLDNDILAHASMDNLYSSRDITDPSGVVLRVVRRGLASWRRDVHELITSKIDPSDRTVIHYVTMLWKIDHISLELRAFGWDCLDFLDDVCRKVIESVVVEKAEPSGVGTQVRPGSMVPPSGGTDAAARRQNRRVEPAVGPLPALLETATELEKFDEEELVLDCVEAQEIVVAAMRQRVRGLSPRSWRRQLKQDAAELQAIIDGGAKSRTVAYLLGTIHGLLEFAPDDWWNEG